MRPMVEEVRIQNLGVIEEAVLELSPGFNVVTGETGAGKTMVVTSLGLLFGGRADPQRVRPGADRASVEGRIIVAEGGKVAARVEEAGGELDDGRADRHPLDLVGGPVAAHLGGRQVPVAMLINVADDLVAVHGQSDQQRLLQAGAAARRARPVRRRRGRQAAARLHRRLPQAPRGHPARWRS